LLGCDRDGDALTAAAGRLGEFAGRFQLVRASFAELGRYLAPESCDGILFDLGVSSPQIDWPDRGFSFQRDGPLDMRMDRTQGTTAGRLVNEASADELARLFRELGEEPEARRLARAIENERRSRRLETTRQLAQLIERISPRRGRRAHPATRVFQALRMAVNEEQSELDGLLDLIPELVRPKGRAVVISFMSLEDRKVKVQFRKLQQEGRATTLTKRPLRPTDEEIEANPASRSAKLRALEMN
jgi:16S rRNA (cytosine1402-N4)-methyltransferase